jgi:hypothetical protein
MRYRFVQKIVIALAVGFSLGCSQPDANDCFQRAGKESIIEQVLPHFHSLVLNDMITYQLRPSIDYKITITGPENWINEISYDINDGILTIKDENNCKLIRNKRKQILVDIYAPAFEEVLNQSFEYVRVMDTLIQDKLHWINENAPSNCSILFHGDSCIIEMPKGTGDIVLKGQSHFTSLYSNAIGKLDASEMITQYLNCNHNSLQDIHAHSKQYLYVVFKNKGNLIMNQSPIQLDLLQEDEGQLIIAD